MSRSSSLLHACAVDVMRGKPDVGNFPACGSPGLVTPGLRRQCAYRRAYVASPRLTTTDVGLTPRLAYARVVHTAPGADVISGGGIMFSTCASVCACMRTGWPAEAVSDRLAGKFCSSYCVHSISALSILCKKTLFVSVVLVSCSVFARLYRFSGDKQ